MTLMKSAKMPCHSKLKVIFVVTEDWYFISHRFELARHFQNLGWNVLVATQVNKPEDKHTIVNAGLSLVSLPIERGKLFSIGDILYLWRLIRLYWVERPDVVHHVAMKPVLYGSLAALCTPRLGVVNALAGLGFLFTSSSGVVRGVRAMALMVFRRLFSRAHTRVILQNSEDLSLFRDQVGVPADNLRLIRGAGVDVSRYQAVVHGPRESPVVVMVARMLRDKGVGELIEAARQLQRVGVCAQIQLIGGIDIKNPNSLTLPELNALKLENAVEWLGHQANISEVYAKADIAVLPSYREGMPKSLLEAAACGLPIVTTDTSGCREVVAEGENGYLVPVRDPRRLAEALEKLITNPVLRARMGAASRARAEREFRLEVIIKKTLAVYDEVSQPNVPVA